MQLTAYETGAILQDDESGIYAQPDVAGGTIPESPQLYSEIEWREEFLGDVVYDKPPMILVGQHAALPTQLMLQSLLASSWGSTLVGCISCLMQWQTTIHQHAIPAADILLPFGASVDSWCKR